MLRIDPDLYGVHRRRVGQHPGSWLNKAIDRRMQNIPWNYHMECCGLPGCPMIPAATLTRRLGRHHRSSETPGAVLVLAEQRYGSGIAHVECPPDCICDRDAIPAFSLIRRSARAARNYREAQAQG